MSALLVALAGLLVGELLRRRLVTGGYRLDDDLGAPPRALGPVVPVLVAASWWLVAARVAEPAGWVAVPAYLLLVVVGVGCAWVDLDVHRIPDGLLRPGGVLVAALLVVATVATGHWTRLAAAAVAGVAAYLAFFLLALPAWGGPAYGDVKLAAVLSAALGWLSPWLALPVARAARGGGRLRRQRCRRHRAAPRPAGRAAYPGGLRAGAGRRGGPRARALRVEHPRIHLLSRSPAWPRGRGRIGPCCDG